MIVIRQIRNFFRHLRKRRIDWIFLDIDDILVERPEPPRNFVEKRILPPPKLSLKELRARLQQISTIKNIQGIIIHLRKLPAGNAQIQSLRDILSEFKAKGKMIIIYAQSYSFLGYYLASVADKIYLQKGGDLDIVGLELSKVFLKDLLDKYDIKMDVVPISPYKSAGDMFRRSDISEEDREQYQRFLDSAYEVCISELAESLDKSEEEMKDLIDNAPYIDEKAKELGLIDDYINEDDLEEIAKSLQKKKQVTIIEFSKSEKMLPLEKKRSKKNHIAIISATGMIVQGKSKKPPIKPPIDLPTSSQVGDQTLVRKLRTAFTDDRIKAVVLHVNSRGGSAAASEAIRSASLELRKKKPLVVYLSDIAASGGYYIASAANYVFAQSLTLTGSIGVIAMKPVLDKALEEQGIHSVYLRKGEHAGYLSPEKSFTEEERKMVREQIESLYDLFLDHVAEFRGMEKEKVNKLAGGRIWSGQDAVENGLVDEIGNIYNAVEKAIELAGLKKEKCTARDFRQDTKCEPIMVNQEKNNLLQILNWIEIFVKEKSWMILPEIIQIK